MNIIKKLLLCVEMSEYYGGTCVSKIATCKKKPKNETIKCNIHYKFPNLSYQNCVSSKSQQWFVSYGNKM
jgi:hypothetical protein